MDVLRPLVDLTSPSSTSTEVQLQSSTPLGHGQRGQDDHIGLEFNGDVHPSLRCLSFALKRLQRQVTIGDLLKTGMEIVLWYCGHGYICVNS